MLAPEGAELDAFQATRAFGSSLLGRFDEAAALVPDSPDRITTGDHQVCAALFGQLALTEAELEHLAGLFTTAVAGLATDAVERRAAIAHSLAVTRLLQGQPILALPLLDASRAGATTTASRAAVDATRGVALAQQGDLDGARQLLHDLQADAPWSPWLRVLEQAIEVPA